MKGMKKNPLTRAVRIDKMTVAALEATLREYLVRGAIREIPTLRMLTESRDILQQRGSRLAELLRAAAGEKAEICLKKVSQPWEAERCPQRSFLRYWWRYARCRSQQVNCKPNCAGGDPAVMGRVQEDKLLLDVRTIADAELQPLVEAVRGALCEGKGIK